MTKQDYHNQADATRRMIDKTVDALTYWQDRQDNPKRTAYLAARLASLEHSLSLEYRMAIQEQMYSL